MGTSCRYQLWCASLTYWLTAIFYYDYALTFGNECTRIWKQPRTRSNYLFFLNRYLTFFGVSRIEQAPICVLRLSRTSP